MKLPNNQVVFVHRDYHSRNLMLVNSNTLGVIDFQDAVVGAITYDLASLLRDAYVEWPQERVAAWVEDFRQLLQHQPQWKMLAKQPNF
jgi:aminoglycoside/choline kinase family phosphotransferase